MKYLFFFLPILCSVIVVSCTSAPQPVSSTSVLNVGGAVEVEIWASNGCVKPGETVKLRATVSNKSTKTFAVALEDKPVLDIVFGNPDTGPRLSDGRPLTPELTRLDLKPGESKSIEMDWQTDKKDRPTNVTALFVWDKKFPALEPSVTIYVGACPGLGP